ACATIGRDPGELHYSVALIAVAGRDESEFARRAAAVGREPAELREHGLAGTAAEIVDRLGALAEAGVDTVYLQIMDLADLDHLDFIAREVAPRLP
ncbi:LLM class F420-dependent oxidoreductase, partial [Cryobacterium sp. 10I1]|nr:LLM class F420-dependent oxidoreductase [Cryobacterium sp. 10I1]